MYGLILTLLFVLGFTLWTHRFHVIDCVVSISDVVASRVNYRMMNSSADPPYLYGAYTNIKLREAV